MLLPEWNPQWYLWSSVNNSFLRHFPWQFWLAWFFSMEWYQKDQELCQGNHLITNMYSWHTVEKHWKKWHYTFFNIVTILQVVNLFFYSLLKKVIILLNHIYGFIFKKKKLKYPKVKVLIMQNVLFYIWYYWMIIIKSFVSQSFKSLL